MAIYTKRGDRGETSLYDEANRQDVRISKSSLLIRVIGSIDELNAYLGICVTYCKDMKTGKYLTDIQRSLFTIGSILAGSKLIFSKTETKRLEKIIDELEGKLPPLKNFILPGGTKLASHLQYARSLTRRAERNLVKLSGKEDVKFHILQYVNRLSDLLFILSRNENHRNDIVEEIWKGKKNINYLLRKKAP